MTWSLETTCSQSKNNQNGKTLTIGKKNLFWIKHLNKYGISKRLNWLHQGKEEVLANSNDFDFFVAGDSYCDRRRLSCSSVYLHTILTSSEKQPISNCACNGYKFPCVRIFVSIKGKLLLFRRFNYWNIEPYK